jgi:hypothetical protein
MRRTLALALLVVFACSGVAQARVHAYTGSLHEHSGYSDGWPGSRPADFFASGRRHGLDFMGASDHSDNTGLPFNFSGYCLDPSQDGYDPANPLCLDADPVNPADGFRKWDATGEQALAATTPAFTAFRGFEWTSDRFGHINVYFSSNWANAKADGGYADMSTFYGWLTRPVALGGGADGLATFNHPGDKKLSTSDPAYNWDDFTYVPAADAQMVGIEVYNSTSDFARGGAHGSPPEGWYSHALDKGWHVGAVGAEDLGHHFGDDWGGPAQAKTVILGRDRSAAALKAAMQARRFYAVQHPGDALQFRVDGQQMGARLQRRIGKALEFDASATGAAGGGPIRLELVTSGGKVVASAADGDLAVTRPVTAAEKWYYVRASQGDAVIAYSSPVWVNS